MPLNDSIVKIKEFKNIIGRTASNESYNAYCRVKNELKTKKVISVDGLVSYKRAYR